MTSLLRVWLVAGLLAWAPVAAQAHFLWVVAGPQAADGKVHLYFSEEAEPDNPELLSRIAMAKLHQWGGGVRQELALSRGADSLEATPQGSGPQTYFVEHSLGVITKGEQTFLLNYAAKCYSSTDPRLWTAIGQPELLGLEVTPRMSDGETVLHVTWQGKPLKGAAVQIDAAGQETIEGTTDERGNFQAALPMGKRYSIRAKHVEATAGERDGKAYAEARHYSTLALQLPESLPVTPLPHLAAPVTSFGGAVLGSDLYVYGGHLGEAHHYSKEGQSGDLLKLDLGRQAGWEVVSSGPKRTGTALVVHGSRLIRVGGFQATNSGSEDEKLESMADVAAYDPATKTWTELTPLPQGRSSHDAVVIGDQLYVVGGWAMAPGSETQWHATAIVADLTQSPLVWTELPQVPFQRRALSLGAWQGKLVAIGGMQSKGGTTTATAIYDPAARAWSEGPSLQGTGMDGFGTSAYLVDGTLYVSTMSGSVQRLSADGSRWDVVAQLTQPRFFHRLLPTPNHQLLFVGGAHMSRGKISELELLDPALWQ
jgi:uncharacterized GH25 family protein